MTVSKILLKINTHYINTKHYKNIEGLRSELMRRHFIMINGSDYNENRK